MLLVLFDLVGVLICNPVCSAVTRTAAMRRLCYRRFRLTGQPDSGKEFRHPDSRIKKPMTEAGDDERQCSPARQNLLHREVVPKLEILKLNWWHGQLHRADDPMMPA